MQKIHTNTSRLGQKQAQMSKMQTTQPVLSQYRQVPHCAEKSLGIPRIQSYKLYAISDEHAKIHKQNKENKEKTKNYK